MVLTISAPAYARRSNLLLQSNGKHDRRRRHRAEAADPIQRIRSAPQSSECWQRGLQAEGGRLGRQDRISSLGDWPLDLGDISLATLLTFRCCVDGRKLLCY